MNAPAINRHERRSEAARALDRQSRQLIHHSAIYGHYVRLYYLETDDSFYLEWRLPDGGMGDKYYTNPDECFFSLSHCQRVLARSFEAKPETVSCAPRRTITAMSGFTGFKFTVSKVLPLLLPRPC